MKRNCIPAYLTLFLCLFFSGISGAKILPKACFLSEGTLVNALSNKITMEDPVSGAKPYATDAIAGKMRHPIAGILCNPMKLQVLILHEYDTATKSWPWGLLTISNQQAVYSPAISMQKIERAVAGRGLGLVFSADGEALAAQRYLGRGDNWVIVVFSTSDFTEVASIPTNKLLPNNSNLISINSMNGTIVEVLGSSNGMDSIWQFPRSAVVQKVIWDSATSRVDRVSMGTNLGRIAKGNKDGGIDGDGGGAFWDSAPGLGSFFANVEGEVAFLERGSSAPPLSTRGLISYGVWMTGKDEAIVVGKRYRSDGSTREDSCGSAYQTYRMKAGATELEPIGPCNAIDPWGEVAIDTRRGLIFNTSKHRPDKLLQLPDFSDPQESHAKKLQNKYNLAIRTAFAKSNPKERYVPSVSNTKTYSETLFYVGGQPVTRYQDYVTSQSGYSESVEMVDLVYEIRNNHTQPLSIRFRVDGVAQGSSWQVRTLGGGFWRGILGGRFSSENVRERESLSIPVRLEKTVVLRPGETFKSKDVWGERPARAEELRILPVEIKEVSSAWLDSLRGLLEKRIPATTAAISPYMDDPMAAWAKDRLQAMQQEFESTAQLQRSRFLARAVKFGSVSVPKDFDIDFPSDIAVDVLNQNSVGVEVELSIGKASSRISVPARGQATAVLRVHGVARKQLTPRIMEVR